FGIGELSISQIEPVQIRLMFNSQFSIPIRNPRYVWAPCLQACRHVRASLTFYTPREFVVSAHHSLQQSSTRYRERDEQTQTVHRSCVCRGCYDLRRRSFCSGANNRRSYSSANCRRKTQLERYLAGIEYRGLGYSGPHRTTGGSPWTGRRRRY